jgi:hypothetical protein
MGSNARIGRSGYLSMIAVAAATALLTGTALAQNPPATAPSVGDAEWRRQMEARLGQLERENAQLRTQVTDVAANQQAVMKDAESRGVLSWTSGQPRLTTPDFFDVNKYASEGDFPGSFRIPGTRTSFQIGGYVQLDAIFDGDNIGNDDAFVVSSIPTEGGGGNEGAGNTNFSVRQTRLFLKTQTPTDTKWGSLVTYLEIDFMGTDGTEPRLRHAYGQIGDKKQLLAGQTWSAFQDATVFPATLDAQGPPGMITSRRPQVRYRQDFNEHWLGVIALEDPTTELTTPVGVTGFDTQPLPDLAGHVRWNQDWGHLQLGAVARYLEFDPAVGGRESDLGYGLNLSGSFKTIKLDEKHIDSVLFQIAGGNGIARYINDTGGLGLDGVIVAPGAELEPLNAVAGMIAYQHWWDAKWGSTIGYSMVMLDDEAGQAGTDYESGQYGVLNLRYYPTERVMLGGEVLYGIREDVDGSEGDDLRLQFSAQYKF